MKRWICMALVLVMLSLSGCSMLVPGGADSCEGVLQNLCTAYTREDYSLAVKQYAPSFLARCEVSENELVQYFRERRTDISRELGTNRFNLTFDMYMEPVVIVRAGEPVPDERYFYSEDYFVEEYGFAPNSVTDAGYVDAHFYANGEDVSDIRSLFVCANGKWYICDDEAP